MSDRVELSEVECPELRLRLDDLTLVAIPPPTRDIIILHPMVYHIVIDFGGGRLDTSLHEEDHPLVRWALETHRGLARCTEQLSK